MASTKIDQTLDIRRILQQASNDQAACVFWWKGESKIMRSKLSFEAPNPKTEIAVLLNQKAPTPPKEASLLIYLNHIGIIAFQTEFIRSEKNEWIFKHPETATLNQRRQTGRYPIPKAYEYSIKIEQGNKKFSGTIKDLSESGLCMELEKPLSEKDQKTIIRGTVLSDVEFKIQNIGIQCQGIIQSTRGNEIGIECINLSEKDAVQISTFLLLHFAQHLPRRFDFLSKLTVISG